MTRTWWPGRFFGGQRTSRRKPRFTRLLVVEQLEDRTLLSTTGANVFATFDGVLASDSKIVAARVA